MRTVLAALLGASTLLAVPAATAKDFGPGDVRVCGASGCAPIVRRAVLPQLRSFYFSGPALTQLSQPPLGAPYVELRFRNGYATGIVATARLDRFLSYGVHLERFARDVWYGVPGQLAAEIRRLAAGLRPLRITRAALARSR